MTEQRSTNDLHREISACLPQLRAFALFLARDRTLADDLVQEAVVRALGHTHQFEPNTNFKAWITTILRNAYYNEMRRRKLVSDTNPQLPSPDPAVSGGQEAHVNLRDFERAFGGLHVDHREALLLVGASGFTYEEAAEVAGCAVGTMKSRVWRARSHLQSLLDPEAKTIGPGPSTDRDRPSPSEAGDADRDARSKTSRTDGSTRSSTWTD